MSFKFYQPNNKQEIAYDCVIRALSKVFNKSWLEIFDELVKIARTLQVVPNEDKCFNEYLKAYPLKKIKKQKPTIKEFSRTHKGTYIVKSSGHLVAIENGDYFDCWDSGNLKIYKYWLIKSWEKELKMTLKELAQKTLKQYSMINVQGRVKEIPGDWKDETNLKREVERYIIVPDTYLSCAVVVYVDFKEDLDD